MPINFNEYDFVIHKESKMKFIVRRNDTPYNKWDNHLNEEIMCYPFHENELILGERKYYRHELDRQWVKLI